MNAQPMVPGLVSVILPVFNRPEFLRSAVDQIFAQSYGNWELIIVDDGSTDSTPSVIVGIRDQCPEKVTLVQRENGGPGAARESGRVRARGEFIQYFDSDDEIDPQKFAKQIEVLRDRPECGIVYCQTQERTLGHAAEPSWSQFTGEAHANIFPRILSGCLWPTITPLFRRELSDRLGPWMQLRQEEDWEYDARIGAAGAQLAYLESPLACTVHHAGPRSSGGEASSDPVRLRDRCLARLRILEHATAIGTSRSDPNMQNFAGGLFLLARQCAIAGLESEALQLAGAAAKVSTGPRSAKVAIFRFLAPFFGAKTISLAAGRAISK